MNTEKIEKLKKGLTNSQISDSIKSKIREQIARLEKEDADTSNIVVKDEETVVVTPESKDENERGITITQVKKERKPRTKKEATPIVEKPLKRTVLVVAKEIRQEGESWDKARERASKLINKKKDEVEEKSKKELDKLLKYIASRKELDGITGKDLIRDAKRNAKQLGRRTVTHSGETSNQYGTYENKVGKTYYENRDGHGDRLSNKHKKGMPFLEKGGNINEEALDKEALKYITGREITLHHREAKNIAYKVKGQDDWKTMPIEELNEVIKNHKTSLILFAPEKDKFAEGGTIEGLQIGDIVANTRSNNIGIVRVVFDDGGGDARTDADGVVSISELEIYNPEKHKNYHIAPSTKKEIGDKYENGGDFMSGVYSDGGKIDNKHSYMMLSRLKSDCDYYLGNGHRSENSLWADNVDEHIEEMKRLWNSLPEDGKPEWLSMEDILDYEKKMKSEYNEGGDLMSGVYAEGGALYSAYTDNPIKYLELMGAKPSNDLNFSTEKNGINYYIGFRNKSGLKKAIVVAFIEDENNYMIDKKDLREMSLTANEKDVDVIELYTNYGLELRSNEKSKTVGFDKIHKVTQFENGGDFMSGVYADGGTLDAPKKISEAEAKEIFNKGLVIYVKDGDDGQGTLETGYNVSMISQRATDMNIYSGLKKSDKWDFDVLTKWIREKVDYPIEFYTLMSPDFLYLENGKKLENGGDFTSGIDAKGGKILKQISTHKAVKDGDKIKIYQKGLDIDNKDFDDDFKQSFPDMFRDKYLYSIPLNQEDDLFDIFERYEENNRINIAQANGEFANGGELTKGFLGKIEKVSYEGGETGFMGSLFYNKDLIRYFPSGVGNTKEDIQKTMESFLKSLEPIKVYKNSEGYLVFYKQRGVEAKKQFDNKSDANAFFEALKNLENTEIKYNYGGSVTNDRLHVNHSEDYELRYAKGTNRKGYGNVKYANGGNVNQEKQFSLDFYTKKNDREPYYDDKIIKAYSVKDVVEKAKRIAKLEEFEYVEIYHDKHFVGSISRDKGFDFVEGKGYDDYIAENETPEVFENEHGVRVQSKVAPENKSTIGDWIGKTTISREAIAYGKGGEIGDTINSNEWRVESYGKDFEKEKKVCDEFRKRNGNDSIIVEDKGIFYVLLRNSKKYPAKRVYADGGDINNDDDMVTIIVDDYPYYLQKMGDTTHFKMSNSLDGINKVWGSHIGEHRTEKYYEDVKSWLKGGSSPEGKSYTSSNQYAKGGSITGGIINLVPLELVPLSTQLSRFTGDSLAVGNYVDENGGNYSTAEEAIIVHKESGQKFRIPSRIYRHIDEYNLVINKAGNAIIVYETKEKVADIVDGKLDFLDGIIKLSNRMIKAKIYDDFESGYIPSITNSDDEYKKIENALNRLYSLYEDEDVDNKENIKLLNDRIKFLEDITHRLERKYAKGGTIDDVCQYVTTEDKNQFIDYVYKFYGKDGIYANEFDKKGFSKEEIKTAVNKYLQQTTPYNWGGGDSVDRERVRIILENKYVGGGDLARIKVGQGFFQSGYGKGLDKQSSIYLINDKYYAKSKKASLVAGDGDMLDEGYVCVNKEGEAFFQCWLDDHKKVSEINKKALGGTIVGFEDPLLQGVVDIDNTGLVGETNAMSSGEMFANGGEITASKWDSWGFERDGDIGFSNRFAGLKNKKGDISNGILHFEGNGSAEFEYIDENGNIYQSTEMPFHSIDLTGAPHYGKDSFANGGEIPNNYEGKTAELIWNDLKQSQRHHFLLDHNKTEIQSTPQSIEDDSKKIWRFLPTKAKQAFIKHVQAGQYESGGALGIPSIKSSKHKND